MHLRMCRLCGEGSDKRLVLYLGFEELRNASQDVENVQIKELYLLFMGCSYESRKCC
jgi:hypothetical protein